MNLTVVQEYADAMAAGDEFPPVLLFQEGTTYWIGDGFHRCQAARQHGLDAIDAEVRPGTKRDAILASCGANADHGVRRTNEDKQQAVDRLLADEEWAQWANTEIARYCDVSHTFVGNRRSILQPLQDNRLVKRGDSTYLMNTKRTPCTCWMFA